MKGTERTEKRRSKRRVSDRSASLRSSSFPPNLSPLPSVVPTERSEGGPEVTEERRGRVNDVKEERTKG